MSVVRDPHESNYTVVSNTPLKDQSLSLKAKGLLVLMLSLPETWDYTLAGLSEICKEKRDSIRTALNELETAGYVRRRRSHDGNGKFGSNEYEISESPRKWEKTPSLENPTMVTPSLEKPTLENPTMVKAGTDSQGTVETVENRPLLDNPTTETPLLETPLLEKPTQLNKEILSKEQSSKELQNKDKSNKDSTKGKSRSVVYYPEDENLDKAFKDFIDMRKKNKKPMTDRAIDLAMKKLKDLSMINGSMNNSLAIKIIDQSIYRSWMGLFPLKEGSEGGKIMPYRERDTEWAAVK